MTAEGDAVRAASRLLAGVSTAVLVLAFVALAVAFALLGTLDDWFRIVSAIAFLAVALALVGRWRGERNGSAPHPE